MLMRLTALGLLLAIAAPLRAAATWQPDPVGPDGVTRIIVEAEDMAGVDQDHFGKGSPDWRVGRAGYDFYENNTFGGHWQSRCRTAMTDAGDNPAAIHATVQVPKAGKYKLWAKYECRLFLITRSK